MKGIAENIWIILPVALGCVAIFIAAWTMYQQRVDFPSQRRYWARNIGCLLFLIAGALAEVHARLGYSGNFLIAGAVVAWVGVGVFIWGGRGYQRK